MNMTSLVGIVPIFLHPAPLYYYRYAVFSKVIPVDTYQIARQIFSLLADLLLLLVVKDWSTSGNLKKIVIYSFFLERTKESYMFYSYLTLFLLYSDTVVACVLERTILTFILLPILEVKILLKWLCILATCEVRWWLVITNWMMQLIWRLPSMYRLVASVFCGPCLPAWLSLSWGSLRFCKLDFESVLACDELPAKARDLKSKASLGWLLPWLPLVRWSITNCSSAKHTEVEKTEQSSQLPRIKLVIWLFRAMPRLTY